MEGKKEVEVWGQSLHCDEPGGERGGWEEAGSRRQTSKDRKEKKECKGGGASENGAAAFQRATAAKSGGDGGGPEAGHSVVALGEAWALAKIGLSAPVPACAKAGGSEGGAGAAGGERDPLVPQGKVLRVRRFSYAALSSATHNFSKRLGSGGFGTVFDGALASGTRIAVKKLVDAGAAETSQREQMATEVEILTLTRRGRAWGALFEAKFGLVAPPPPVAAAHGAVGAAAAGPAASAPATTPPPPPSHLAHVLEPSPPQGIPLASSPAARGSAGAAGGAAGDEAECCVCMEGRKTHVFMPCRHMCVCAGCASEIMAGSKACPMCRGVSTDCFEIYM